ncbi:MAG: hypothetical protein ACW98Y_18075 [Candidatus Thorarchaeota archaeon]
MTLRYYNGTGPRSRMGPSLLDRPIKFSTSPPLEILTHRFPKAIFRPANAVIYHKQPWNNKDILANRRYIQKDESVTQNTIGPYSVDSYKWDRV